jgi:hypothetical protein
MSPVVVTAAAGPRESDHDTGGARRAPAAARLSDRKRISPSRAINRDVISIRIAPIKSEIYRFKSGS